MELFRDINGKVYAIRIWRIVFYLSHWRNGLNRGGTMTQFKGRRTLAEYLFWRINFVKTNKPFKSPTKYI